MTDPPVTGGPPRQALAAAARPSVHVTPASGWLNDPNGPIHWRGRHHLFFQHNPLAPVWAPAVHWGHVVSDDLVTWKRLAHALEPSAAGPDAGGCWSGCVDDDGGVPTAVYSGRAAHGGEGAESVCLARGDAELLRWRKDERNPVLAGPPAGLGVTAFRDPFVWRERGAWRMLMGAGLAGQGAVLAYESADLLAWRYRGVLVSGDDVPASVAAGSIWECPQLVRFDGGDVLIVSVWDGEPSHVLALIGSLRGDRFEVQRVDRLDHGADFYAPATMTDADGRRLLWGWSWEGRDEAAARAQGWAGVLTLPRVLNLGPEGELEIAPAPELAGLRGEGRTSGARLLEAERPVDMQAPSACFELRARIAGGARGRVRLKICASPGGEEETVIAWDPVARSVTFDRSRSSTDPAARGGMHGGTLAPRAGGSGDDGLDLRVFVDAGVVEVYANGGFVLTERIHPTRPDATGISVSSTGRARLEAFDVWPLAAGIEPPGRG